MVKYRTLLQWIYTAHKVSGFLGYTCSYKTYTHILAQLQLRIAGQFLPQDFQD